VQIEISVTQERNGSTFSFKDNGPGIDKFFASQVFGIYQRLDAKPSESGTGMGLPICRRIIEDQHKGRIGFESVAGEGAKFFFWLPDVHQD
jgi:light-regulated signal transduction histidine kinase (bacteriophytochrome)